MDSLLFFSSREAIPGSAPGSRGSGGAAIAEELGGEPLGVGGAALAVPTLSFHLRRP